MAQHVVRDLLHVLGDDERAAADERVRLRHVRQRERRARRRAVGDVRRRLARGGDEGDEIAADPFVDVHRRREVSDAGDGVERQHAPHRDRRRGRIEVHAEDAQLLVGGRIVDAQLHHEAVDLRLGERVRPLMLDRILRGDDDEGVGERVRRVADGDLPLLHRLEQRALDFGGSAVDLVGQHEVREDRPEPRRESAPRRIEDQRAGDVSREEVGRELHALEGGVDRRRQRLDEKRFRQPRQPFDEHVPANEQRDDEPVDGPILPHHHPPHLGPQPVDGPVRRRDLIIDTGLIHAAREFMRPKKKWGQNFLRNKGAAEKIVAAVEAQPDELVLEIGPGEGALTQLLVDLYPGRVTAIEIDPDLAAALRTRFGSALEVIEGDALTVPLPTRPFRAVGNLPYNVGTPILRRVIADPNIRRAVFMLQKEVADRLVAKPSTSAYGYLTLYTQVFAAARVLMTLEAGSFFPAPKVRSAVVALNPESRSLACERCRLLELLRTAFRMRRKKIVNNLSEVRGPSRDAIKNALEEAGVREDARAEALSLTEFDVICSVLTSETYGSA
jgi:16S rRNA (adenine1518-N6/adenine1519-N6)-dimethyltransferase